MMETYNAIFTVLWKMQLWLYENGYIPIPIIPLTKRPIISDWSSIKNDYAYIENLSLEYPHAGVGVLLNDLIVFDIDILDDKQSFLLEQHNYS